MKKYLALLLFVACGQNPVEVYTAAPKDGVSCFGEQTATGTLIRCANGSAFLPNGAQGIAGQAGANALVNIVNSAPSCPTGGITLVSGTDSNYDGIITSADTNIQTATICNGLTGATGASGVTPEFSFVSTILACPTITTSYREALLCLQNGKILASFSENGSALTTRLSFIPAGSYMNTDSSGCNFTVTTLVDGSSKVSWTGGFATCQKN